MMGGMGTSVDAGDAPAGPGHTPCLPEPTGPCPVGTTSLWLTDTSRPDPWVAEVSARELMVSLWYPATVAGGHRARYMTPAESELLLAGAGITSVPPDVLSTVRTHAVSDASPAGDPRSLPLVVLSPGFTNPRSTRTALAEDLASHGYVVAGIDHTYESHATTFPDGRVTTCLARQARRRGGGFQEKVAAGRAADVSFVLDELSGAHPAWPGAGLIDPSRMGMSGHSAGGAAAIAAMLADSRILAGIDTDGVTAALIPDGGLSRPFLFLGKQANYTPGSGGNVTTWERDWALMTGWKRWLVVAGAVHASFTDLALLADQLGIDIDAHLPGARSLDITRAYVRAFFDQHLRGTPQALLDQPSPRYPEVTFCSPDAWRLPVGRCREGMNARLPGRTRGYGDRYQGLRRPRGRGRSTAEGGRGPGRRAAPADQPGSSAGTGERCGGGDDRHAKGRADLRRL
jgi:dienelactone hydrolase